VFVEHKCIRYYDSFPDGNEFHNNVRNGVMQYLKDEYKAVTGGDELNDCDWVIKDCSSETPRQRNGERIRSMEQWCHNSALDSYFNFDWQISITVFY
jgi:hypothetical protein